jgi:3-mercaptopyruvate sulfurtransferase SseA
MSNRKIDVLFAVTILVLTTSACNAPSPRTEPGPAPTQIIEPVFTPSQEDLPLTEDQVTRVSVEEAKAALDGGAAIIVDVRSARAAFVLLHNGRTRVTPILGGFEAWIDAGYPVE